MASARRSQRIHWTLRVIAEKAALAARREAMQLRGEILELKASKLSAAAEFSRIVKGLREENDQLRTELAKTSQHSGRVFALRTRR